MILLLLLLCIFIVWIALSGISKSQRNFCREQEKQRNTLLKLIKEVEELKNKKRS